MTVQFQEGEVLTAPKPRTLTNLFIRARLAQSPQGAAALMFLAAFLLFVGATYLVSAAL